MSMVIHPDVQEALGEAEQAKEHMHNSMDKIRAHTSERVNKDKDIAVKVGTYGNLVKVWLKPGVLERKKPNQIAKEITGLVTDAADEASTTTTAWYREAHQLLEAEQTT
ncbi:Uncharacterised protein [Mycobacteroides abscessus subsp. abscessus]|uniref:hypothetical protein n=1 Tax=Mycobacteroides abscessus TaxID=36809 RepID=UPI0009283450|nr:hypothetical protein [Mycobacteroides abscessus]SHU71281.1 Uncharacterised protein [Mycobacteroides abscessus subsp. abscessus]